MSQPPSQPYPGEQPYASPYAPPGASLAQPGAPYDRSPAAPAGHFALPGYPQPGHPPQGRPGPGIFPGFPVAPAAAPAAKSPMLPILLGSVAVLLVLCFGGVATVFLVLKTDADRPTGSPAPAGATQGPRPDPTGTATPTAEPSPAAKVQLLEPARLNGRPKLTDPQFAGAARSLRDSLSRAPGATDSIGAIYGDPVERNIVIVAAVAAPIPDPERELSATLLGAGTTGMKLTGVVTVSPGPLGGRAQCGNSNVAGVRVAMCAWADDGSVGWFIWYFKSTGQVKDEFPKLRGLIEKVG